MTSFTIDMPAAKQIREYFSNPSNHSDDDVLHVSREEMAMAKGKIDSPEARQYLEKILSSDDGYTTLRALQSEGFFNDSEVSMRDLYTAERAYGYDGEPVDLIMGSRALLESFQVGKWRGKPVMVYSDGNNKTEFHFFPFTYAAFVSLKIIDGALAGEGITCKFPPAKKSGIKSPDDLFNKELVVLYNCAVDLKTDMAGCSCVAIEAVEE